MFVTKKKKTCVTDETNNSTIYYCIFITLYTK